MPGGYTLPEQPLIQYEACATRLNEWFWSASASCLHVTRRKNYVILNEKGEVTTVKRAWSLFTVYVHVDMYLHICIRLYRCMYTDVMPPPTIRGSGH